MTQHCDASVGHNYISTIYSDEVLLIGRNWTLFIEIGVVCATYMSVALGTKQVFECYLCAKINNKSKRRHSMSNPEKKTNQLKITRKRITDESKRLNCFGIFRLKLFSLEQKKYTIFSSYFQLPFAFRWMKDHVTSIHFSSFVFVEWHGPN